MKYIEKHYQDLIDSMERAYSATIDTLNYRIHQLQKTIVEQEDELERLKGGDKLTEQIAMLDERPQATKAKAPKKKRTRRKQVLCTCQDCKTYFYAQRRDAKRCPECKRKHNNQAKYAWLKKQRG